MMRAPGVLQASDLADLQDCLSSASFWRPEQLGPQPSWIEHTPFAFWLIGALRPRIAVELGTHGGCSYFSFCQAVQRLGLDTRCYAVDTWKGDEHAGFYDDDVYKAVRARNDRIYSAFSTLIRCTFDEALSRFDDGSVDLLHIDGRHRLADVKHDFETWKRKLSERAVVLFHDTNARARDFGVWQYWAEVSGCYPHFEFLHGHGLGVLGVGRNSPEPVGKLFAAMNDEDARTHVREAYGRLGSALSLEAVCERQLADLAQCSAGLAQRTAEAAQCSAATAAAEDRMRGLEAELRAQSDEAARLSAELAAAEQQAARGAADAEAAREQAGRIENLLEARCATIDSLAADLSSVQRRASQLVAALEDRSAAMAEVHAHSATLVREVEQLRSSTSWRITAPLRWVRRLLAGI